jgi:hypothetical protein
LASTVYLMEASSVHVVVWGGGGRVMGMELMGECGCVDLGYDLSY